MTFKNDLVQLLSEFTGLYEIADANIETTLEVKPLNLSANQAEHLQMFDFLQRNLWKIGAKFKSHPSSDEFGIDCFIAYKE